VQVWRTFVENLDLAIAERKLHKHHRLLAAAGTVLDDVLKQSIQKGDIGSTLPLHLWIEQKEVYLEESRRIAISLLESTIMASSNSMSYACYCSGLLNVSMLLATADRGNLSMCSVHILQFIFPALLSCGCVTLCGTLPSGTMPIAVSCRS
jgi:hypothetical protein